MSETETLYTTPELAELMKVSVVTVKRWRRLGTGPRASKLGKAVRYRSSVVEAFIAARTQS